MKAERAPDLGEIRRALSEMLADLKTFGEHDTAFTRRLLKGHAERCERLILSYLQNRNVHH